MSIETLNRSSRTSPITFGTPARVATKLCGYCGWNIEEQDLEILSFFHCDCWKEYRKDGLLHPMPEDFWY